MSMSVEIATESKPKRRGRPRKAKPREPVRSSAWRDGRVTISVEQKHIDRAIEKHSAACATADAIKEQIPQARHVSCDIQTLRWTERGLRFIFLTPHAIQSDVIILFDAGERANCKATTVRMKPCMVTKSGKKRNHTPTDAELKDLNLRLASEQPHLPAEVPESRFEPEPEGQPSDKPCLGCGKPLSWQDAQKSMTALITRGRSPAEAGRLAPRCDGCIKALIGGHADEAVAATMRGVRGPDVVKRKPRVARAKVSAVSKGVVPTTLGGRPPPVSVLSRREWGLRALRK
jgi:hypothetical protein